jgi:tetratricopeptide (TPR) repeat protein
VEPGRAEPYLALIPIFEDNLGNLEAQRPRYERLLRQEPDAVWLYGMLGAINQRLGRQAEAIDIYQQMIRLDPQNPEAHYRLAQLHLAAGQGQKALSEYQIYQSLIVSGAYSEEATYRLQVLSGYAITWPPAGERLDGRVAIRGTASLPDFQFYKLEYGLGRNPGRWFGIGEIVEQPVLDGVLATWDVSDLPAGEYTIRLTIVDASGNYPPPYEVVVVVGD